MTSDEYSQLGFTKRHAWLIMRINLMRYLDQTDGGHRHEEWLKSTQNQGVMRILEFCGIPWNFQDEGHMHKLGKWLGME